MRSTRRRTTPSNTTSTGFNGRPQSAGVSGRDCLDGKLNVTEEYMEAFRTKSYIEISSKVQCQLNKTTATATESNSSSNTKHSASDHRLISEVLLEPQEETLSDTFRGSDLPFLVVDYLEASWDAGAVCESLLGCIQQTRANYGKVKRAISLMGKRGPTEEKRRRRQAIFSELDSYASLRNPFSAVSPAAFREMRDGHKALFRRLTGRRRVIKRKARMARVWKRVAGFGLVASYAAIATAMLALAVHSVVGLAAAPAAFGYSCLFLRRRSRTRKAARKHSEGGGGVKMVKCRRRRRKGKAATADQLDVAARGMYILMNDMDTMSRLVRRLQDQVEHGNAIAGICVRSRRLEVLKEVVKEFEAQETCFLEQLEELEEHIYLCFLNINRSRRLLIMGQVLNIASSSPPPSPSSPTDPKGRQQEK